jgi:hypothetical protein
MSAVHIKGIKRWKHKVAVSGSDGIMASEVGTLQAKHTIAVGLPGVSSVSIP